MRLFSGNHVNYYVSKDSAENQWHQMDLFVAAHVKGIVFKTAKDTSCKSVPAKILSPSFAHSTLSERSQNTIYSGYN